MRDVFASGTNQAGLGGPGKLGGAAGLFPDTLLHEVTPMIDSTCRIISGREHRAPAGLSMGGESFGGVEDGGNGLKSCHDSLVAAGFTNMNYYISPDTAHVWQTCRSIYYEFAPLLIKN